MRQGFYFVLVVLGLIMLSLPSFAAKAAKRAVGPAKGFRVTQRTTYRDEVKA